MVNNLTTISLYKLSVFVLFLLSCCTILPQIKTIHFYNILWTSLVVIWLFLTYLSIPKFYRNPNLNRLLTYFFIIYVVVISHLNNHSMIANRYLELSQIFIFYWAYLIGYKKDQGLLNKKLIIIMIPIVIYVCIVTLNEYISNPIISRAVKPSTEAGQEYLAKGIGGYDYIYFLVIISTICLYTIRYCSLNKITKSFLLIIVIFFIVNILLSGFMTATLLLFVSLIFLTIMPRINIINSIYIFIFLFLTYYLIDNIFNALILMFEYYDSESLNIKRLIELKTLFESGIVMDSINERFKAYLVSIITIAENPIFGSIFSNPSTDGLKALGIGQHSFILDTFALFGVLWGGVLVVLLVLNLVKLNKRNTKIKNNLPDAMLVIFLVFGFLNNMTPSVGFAAFFVFPVIYSIYFLKGNIKSD